MGKPVVLSVGEPYHLGFGKDHIIYAGMTSENVYSIVQTKELFHLGYAWNLYFPKSTVSLRLDGVNIAIEDVDPSQVRLRVI
jgi:hypothetical protein